MIERIQTGVRMEKRLSQRYQYTVSYTLSRVTDNSFGQTSTGTITDFYHPEWDLGYGNADRRHAAVDSAAEAGCALWVGRDFRCRAGRDVRAADRASLENRRSARTLFLTF